MYTSTFTIKVTVNHHSSCDSAFSMVQGLLKNPQVPAVERVELVEGATNEDINPMKPTKERTEVMSKMTMGVES